MRTDVRGEVTAELEEMHKKFEAASEGFRDLMRKEVTKDVLRDLDLQPMSDKIAADLLERSRTSESVLESKLQEQTAGIVAQCVQKTLPIIIQAVKKDLHRQHDQDKFHVSASARD